MLSPHFDDAVLSCWSVLAGPQDAVVVNVFTGAPAAGTGARWWDRMTGAQDSAERMAERCAEDRAALALAGRTSIDLGFLELQYRADAAAPPLAHALVEVLPQRARIYAPAAIGRHPDHALARDAAVALAATGRQVTLYADLPHAIERGWPTWVADGDGLAEVDAAWAQALRAAGVERPHAGAEVRTLGREVQASKLAALAPYVTQRAALDALAFRPLLHPQTLRYEVFWPLG